MLLIDWTRRVADALEHLEKHDRILTPEAFRLIIDDVVMGKLSADKIAAAHGTQDLVMTALGHVTTAVQGGGEVLPLAGGGWYEFRGSHQPYNVARGFAAAWKAARRLA